MYQLAWEARMSLERRRPVLNVGTALLGVLLIVAAIGALISVSHSSRTGGAGSGVRGSLGAPLVISTLRQGAIQCPVGAAFAPDGAHIAILGSLGSCAPATATSLTTHIAAIYDTRSGATTLYVRLEKLLGIDTSVPLDQQYIHAIHYFNLGWSPDGHSLAIVFTAFNSSDILIPDTEVDAGLILLNTEHGTAQIFHGDSGYFSLPGASGGGFPIWDVQTGTQIPAFAPESGLAYAWNAHGAPYPIVKTHSDFQQLPINAGPRYPVGNPDGSSTFTIWQPGVIAGSSSSMGAAIFTTVFATWSPDGRYVTLLTAGAQLPLAQAPAQHTPPSLGRGTITYPTPSVMPSAPARDAALYAVQRRAGNLGWALVAWNPAGTLLASINCTAPGSQTLELRTTDSAIIQGSAQLPLAASNAGCRNLASDTSAYPAQPLMLLWSPSGDQVLVSDQTSGVLTIWPVIQSAN
jgi:hypothetical protein